MFIELVDSLRCPRGHEESWLVAAVEVFHGRYIARGSLGCPVCHLQFPITDGAVLFDEARRDTAAATEAVDADSVLRLRALLNLTDEGGVVALVGEAARFAFDLEASAQVTLLLVNPLGVSPAPGLSTLWVAGALPMTAGALRGAVLDGQSMSSELVSGVVRALRVGGRLLSPVHIPIPLDVKELARDDHDWVGEKLAVSTSRPVALRRR